jgi:hypothetical protein
VYKTPEAFASGVLFVAALCQFSTVRRAQSPYMGLFFTYADALYLALRKLKIFRAASLRSVEICASVHLPRAPSAVVIL